MILSASVKASAPVSGNIPVVVVEQIDRQVAVVSAALADDRAGLMPELPQLLFRQQSTAFQPGAVLLGVQGCAIGAHDRRRLRAQNLPHEFLFKGAQYAVVEEGAALNHDVFPQFFRASAAYDLVQSVFDDAD